jgi:leucyl aminopeptidase
MKTDMGGAAATLGAAKAIAQLKPDSEVHFISAVTENMISGRAMHPGDILTASNGKTIEVNNTDAEGRLTLADALVFTEKLEVDAIVDLATLTGACVIALGDDMAGLWSDNDELANELLAASKSAGEKLWRMPMEDKYFDGLKSVVADMKNTGPRPGGAITAALFLKQFVKETPWAHLDIAGPVWADKENGYNGAGATGYAVRTLVNWVE